MEVQDQTERGMGLDGAKLEDAEYLLTRICKATLMQHLAFWGKVAVGVVEKRVSS